ncbi:MAG: protein kinase [Myxococcales bacterium]|nr:protein kinase [Myxococcales bacterium]
MSEDAGQVVPGAQIGRYTLYRRIASGGMATVHLGRLVGPVGFSRTVAIKRLHRQFAKDPGFLAMFLDEARLAAKIRHPNVVSTLDVVSASGELFLIMDYVEGESLAHLLRGASQRGECMPLPIALGIVMSMLHGLHAAHEAKSDAGESLGIVHRDVSPQNVLVGVDGIARVADFGVAKAARRIQETEVGQLKGKIAYMAPEQLASGPVDRRVDVFAAGAVLWETLVGRRLFHADHPLDVARLIKSHEVSAPSSENPEVSAELDAIVLRALAPSAEARFASCREMVMALEGVVQPAPQRVIGEWVEAIAHTSLSERTRMLRDAQADEHVRVADPVSLARALDPSANHSATSLLDGPPLETSRPSAPLSGADDTLTTPLAQSPFPPVSSPPTDVAPAPATDSQITAAASWDMTPKKERPRRAALLGVALGAVAFAGALAGFVATRAPEPEPQTLVRSLGWTRRVPLAHPVEPEPAKARPSEVPTARAAPVADKAAPLRLPVKAAVKPPPNCDPPYVKGADGIVRFKRECLK